MIVERIACLRDRVEPVRAGRAGDRSASDVDGEGRRRRPDVCREIRDACNRCRCPRHRRRRFARRAPCPRQRRGCRRRACRCAPNSLAEVSQAPELRKARIVGLERGVKNVVRLGVQHVGTPRQQRDQGLDVLAARTNMPDAAVTGEVAVGVDRRATGADPGFRGIERGSRRPRPGGRPQLQPRGSARRDGRRSAESQSLSSRWQPRREMDLGLSCGRDCNARTRSRHGRSFVW